MAIENKKLKLSQIKLNPDNPRQISKKQQISFICKFCSKEFKSKKACKSRTPVYCSWDCYMNAITKYAGKTFTCEKCGVDFKTDSAYSGHIPKYCSRKCCSDVSKGRTAWNKGKPLSREHKEALSKGRKNSQKCKGPNLYNWRGGEATFKDRSRVYQNNRRTRKIEGGSLDPVFLRHLWDAHKGLCFYCEKPLTDYKCLEHLTSLSKGGKNQPFNLVYSCKSCNSKKRQKSLEDFSIETGRIWLLDKWESVFIYAYGKTKDEQCNTASLKN